MTEKEKIAIKEWLKKELKNNPKYKSCDVDLMVEQAGFGADVVEFIANCAKKMTKNQRTKINGGLL